ncbi:MAG: glycoside hydrolase family 10 protein [Bacteroidales bacterium]
MNRLKYGIACVLVSASSLLSSQTKQEYRGVWFSTVWGLDFPSKPVSNIFTIEKQKKELTSKLDSLQKMNINVLFFQVRNRGDLAYESVLEPWHYVFGGKTGVSPNYDLIRFAIDETHKRNMEFHAWFVCMPLGSDKFNRDKKDLSLIRKRPDLCIKYKDEWYMNPANPATADYLAGVIGEMIRKYNVDGVHLDYIRYPDRTNGYPDEKAFKTSKAKNLSEWRRENINRIVYRVYDTIQSINPEIKLSAAVIGRYNNASHNKSGWRGYEDVFQDAMAWFDHNKIDFITPMTYYQDPLFGLIIKDWGKRLKPSQLMAGVYTSMISPQERDWNMDIIFDQVMIARINGAGGVAHFRAKPLIENTKQIRTWLRNEHYSNIAEPYRSTVIHSVYASTPPPIENNIFTIENRESALAPLFDK